MWHALVYLKSILYNWFVQFSAFNESNMQFNKNAGGSDDTERIPIVLESVGLDC